MRSHPLSVLKNIFLDGNTHRIWQILNKSPLIDFNAWVKTVLARDIFLYRSSFFKNLNLSSQESRYLKELESKGFVEITELLAGPEMTAAQSHFSQLAAKAATLGEAQSVNTKSFWVRLTDFEQKDGLTTGNPFVQLALHEPLLQVLTGYFKQAPFMHSVLLTHSLPTQGEFKNSQLWHQDNDNHRMAKMFVYFTDVEFDEQGPFTFLPADFSAKIKNTFFKRHLRDEQVAQFVDLKEVRKVKGKKLTAFICDTHRCYHMGSRVGEGHERMMLTSLYISLPSPYPKGEQRDLHINTKLSELQQASVVVK